MGQYLLVVVNDDTLPEKLGSDPMPEIYQAFKESNSQAEAINAVHMSIIVRSNGGQVSALILCNQERTKYWFWPFDEEFAKELNL